MAHFHDRKVFHIEIPDEVMAADEPITRERFEREVLARYDNLYREVVFPHAQAIRRGNPPPKTNNVHEFDAWWDRVKTAA